MDLYCQSTVHYTTTIRKQLETLWRNFRGCPVGGGTEKGEKTVVSSQTEIVWGFSFFFCCSFFFNIDLRLDDVHWSQKSSCYGCTWPVTLSTCRLPSRRPLFPAARRSEITARDPTSLSAAAVDLKATPSLVSSFVCVCVLGGSGW